MGAFFTNIQLKKTTAYKTLDVNTVIDFLTELNTAEGFVKVEQEADADKSIIIQHANNSSWLSIYDEELEGQGSRKLNKVAALLSKQFDTNALSLLVHDSDSMYLGLNKNGSLKDSLSNLSKEIDFKKSKPSAWLDILNDKGTFDDVTAAWNKKNLFIEEFLVEFASLVGIDSSQLLTGYEYLSEENSSEGIRLHFAKKDKKIATLGQTKIALIGAAGLGPIKIGEKCTGEFHFTNHGAISDGLDIVVAGRAIEQGLLIPETTKISFLKKINGAQSEFSGALTETVATSGKRIYYVRFENFHFPKGFEPSYPMTNKDAKRYYKLRVDSAFKCDIVFLGQKPGNEELLIFFSPLTNRQDGSFCFNFVNGQVTE